MALVSNDFTVLGASSSVVNGKKIKHVKQVANESGMPLVMLGESAGARMPDRMGAAGRAILGQDPVEYLRDRRTPWVSALLGSCYGSSTWYACLSDFVVMRKGATMAVASSRVTELAIKQAVDPEELGGWELHTGTTGLVDVAVDTDEEALDHRQALPQLPAQPPRRGAARGAGAGGIRRGDPGHSRRRARVAGEGVRLAGRDHPRARPGQLFELKPRFGKSLVTGPRPDRRPDRRRNRQQSEVQGRLDRRRCVRQGYAASSCCATPSTSQSSSWSTSRDS